MGRLITSDREKVTVLNIFFPVFLKRKMRGSNKQDSIVRNIACNVPL